MAMTLDQIKQYAANPSTIPGGGSYGEGSAYNIAQMFPVLKQAVQSGQLTLSDYQGLADPLAKAAQQTVAGISRQGSKQANAVNGAWAQLQSYVDGNGKSLSPFSRQEYAKLPDNVLPTQDDINKGLFDPTNAPIQRIRPAAPAAPAPTDNKAPTPGNPAAPTPGQTNAGNTTTTTPNSPTPNAQINGAPAYSANPNDPPPYGGLVSTSSTASNDAQRVAQEAALQQQLSVQSQQGITDKRTQYLKDLSDVLQKQQAQNMSEAAPGIYEDLNSRGLLRSSALGDSMARELKSLQSTTDNTLEQAAISGENTDLGNYGKIQDTYNAGRNSALQREFSVEDYNSQIQAAKDLGEQAAQLKPQLPSTKQQAEVAAAGSAGPAIAAGGAAAKA